MKISLNWIKAFVDISKSYTTKQLAELLTLRTCEVEGYEHEGMHLAHVVVGKVIDVRRHPNADKLRLADTDIGGRTVQIVCGGVNLQKNMYVAVALPHAQVNWHGAGEWVEMKETNIRGEASHGMICAGEEIGLPPSEAEGIMDLSATWMSSGGKPRKPGTPLAEALGMNDTIFEVDNKSLTHRPDLWGHYGMAREFAAFLGKKLKDFTVKNPNPPTKGPRVKVGIEKSSIAMRFLAVVMTGIKVEASPKWMQERLRAVGMRPVNNIVDVTNYVMHELGYPSHAFDRRTIGNDTLVVRFAKEGEPLETLDHKKRMLTAEDAIITNGERPLGIAGIMGGANSEISDDTTEIVLEAACWNPVMIRKTSSRHGIRSDAAQRFEKSLDPEINGIAFHRCVELIRKVCPAAKMAGLVTDLYPAKQAVRKLKTVTLDPVKVNRKIGVTLSPKQMGEHLKALQFGVAQKEKLLNVTIPSFRATKDINIEDDLVEEVARMHGYEKIAPELPMLPVKLPRENKERALKHQTRDIFSLGLGFSEVNHYSFYGKDEMKRCLLPENVHLKIQNPLTADQTHLRISMLPHLLKSIQLNSRKRDEVKLYEVGRTYIKKEYFPLEEKFICGAVAHKNSKEVFYDALGALQTFLKSFHLRARVDAAKTVPPYAHPGKCASVIVDGKEVAVVFEVHPQILKNFEITVPTAAFELNFTRFAGLKHGDAVYKQLPRFPGIELDVSVLVEKRTSAREVLELIRRTEQTLIADVSLVDIFEDKSLGEGKKSLTFRVLLQSPDRTLTDDEMKTVHARIFEALKGRGFVIR